MHPVSGCGQDVLGPEKPLHWIHTSDGTGGSAAAGPLISSVDAAKPATPRTKPAPIVTVRRRETCFSMKRCPPLCSSTERITNVRTTHARRDIGNARTVVQHAPVHVYSTSVTQRTTQSFPRPMSSQGHTDV